MTGPEVLDVGRDGVMTFLKVGLPIMTVGLVVGLAVSLVQALTQVQEQTVSFAIKLIAVAVTIVAMAGLLGSEMVNFATKLFTDFPSMT